MSRDDNFDFKFPSDSLRDRVIALAGGSGGLGAASAFLLAREGARLLIGYHSNQDRAEALCRHLNDRFGSKCRALQSDICTAEGREALLSGAGEAPLYGVVCLVGNPARVKLDQASEQDLVESWESNYVGPILLARDARQRMEKETTPGSIILFSTMQAMALFPSSTNYAGPKHALLHAARVMAKETAGPSGIRVNVISPGVNRAGMALASIDSGKYDRFVEEGTIPRFGKAEDTARLVRLFLEPDNYITGQVVAVDGGFTLQA